MTPSPDFLALTRKPDLPSPTRFERTVKGKDHIEITNPALTLWRRKQECANVR